MTWSMKNRIAIMKQSIWSWKRRTIDKAIHRILGLCIENFRKIDVFDLMYIRIENLKHRKKLLWLESESIKRYCSLYHEKYEEIEPECRRLVYVPAYFELQGEQELLYDSPAVFIAFLTKVSIIGGTGAVLTKDYLLLDELKNDKEELVRKGRN